MKRNILLLLLFLFVILSKTVAQQGKLFNLTLDWAQFRMDDEHSYIEFYYAYSTKNLGTHTIEGKQYSELLMKFVIIDTLTKEVVVDRMWNMQNEIDENATEHIQISQTRFVLANSFYQAKIFLMDINNASKVDSVVISFKTPNHPSDIVSISDIQFCSSIKTIEKDTANMFYKNTFEVKPNPFNMVDIQYPVLSYYLEIYNLSVQKIGEKLTIKYSIVDNTGKEYITKNTTKAVKDGNSVEAGVINVQKLVGGAYNFVFSVMNEKGNLVATNFKRFFYYDPDVKPSTYDGLSTLFDDEFAIMTEEDIDLLQKQSICIASRNEQTTYKQLKGLNSKQNYMRQFWYERRNDPLQNKSAFTDRLIYVNGKYRTRFNQGWDSDRGRVALQYGIPLEPYIERGKETTNGKPYEVWFYPEVLNGVYFVFADESGFNRYLLMHSTHPNEVKNEDWRGALPGNDMRIISD
jgi:GWxTD domain-containing protein